MINLIKQQKTLPKSTGVYYFSNDKETLYIGKAKNLQKRTKYYFKTNKLNRRLTQMVSEATNLNYYLTETESEAFLLEAQLIKQKNPKYNIQYKNGRSYSYIIFTNDVYPQIKIEKKWQKDAIGPFLSFSSIKNLIQDLLSIFQIRTCSNYSFNKRKKPCLEYYSKKCSAPCVNLINTITYNENVNKMKALFQGKNKEILKQLKIELKNAIKTENFELAQKLYNNINYLDKIKEKQGIFFHDIISLNIVLFYKNIFYLESIKNGAIVNIEYRKYEKQLDFEEMLHQYYIEEPDSKIIGEEKIKFNKYTSKLSLKEKKILEYTKNRFNKLLDEDSEKLSWMKTLNLEKLETIEAYDCSHYNSNYALCGKIVETIDEEQLKNKYKIWKIDKKTYNDLEILEQGLIKRGTKNLPDLILIDGGLTQLKIAKKILFPYKNIIAFAKGEHRKGGIIYGYDEKEIIINNNNLLLLFEKLRTNAHNWAKNNSSKLFTENYISDKIK